MAGEPHSRRGVTVEHASRGQEALAALETGPVHYFRDWPNTAVPQFAAGVYTVWRGNELIYVGMAGRGLTTEQIGTRRAAAKPGGLCSRLNSHASGRRSGDQFCVYVCDRFVLPTLTREQIAAVAAGELLLDWLTRAHIHEHLGYRFVEVLDGRTAHAIEAALRRGALAAGRPLLNPLA